MLLKVQHNLNSVHQLSKHEEQIIRSWWKGLGDQHSESSVAAIIQSLRNQRLWLSCGCLHLSPGSSPIISPVKSGDTYFLRRMSARPNHAKTCEFYDEQVLTSGGDTGEQPIRRAPDWGFDDCVLEASQRTSKTISSTSRNPGATRLSSLAKRLFWLVDKSGLQSWSLDDNRSAITKIVSYAEKTIAYEDVMLKQVLFATERAYTQAWFDSAFAICKGHRVEMGAWWVMPCSMVDIKSRRIQLGNCDLAVDGAIEVFGGDVSPARFPMLAMCRISPKIGGGLIDGVYLHPVAKNGMLVDSNLERETLGDLIQVLGHPRSGRPSLAHIHKPVFKTAEGERPDFVVSNGHGPRLIIETMGFGDADYKERKIALAKNYPRDAVVFDWRTKPGASDQLRARVASWLGAFAKSGQFGR